MICLTFLFLILAGAACFWRIAKLILNEKKTC